MPPLIMFFLFLLVQTNVADLKITGVEKCEGEACANNRKGKLIFFYEWNLVLNWEGKLNGGTGANHCGTIKVPNLSEENEMSDLDVSHFYIFNCPAVKVL